MAGIPAVRREKKVITVRGVSYGPGPGQVSRRGSKEDIRTGPDAPTYPDPDSFEKKARRQTKQRR